MTRTNRRFIAGRGGAGRGGAVAVAAMLLVSGLTVPAHSAGSFANGDLRSSDSILRGERLAAAKPDRGARRAVGRRSKDPMCCPG